ncbi:MAG: hypothetical protein H6700_08255 [Myxococcales bacterium]|nr:hypothetical protein [Myxococcales bacterium]
MNARSALGLSALRIPALAFTLAALGAGCSSDGGGVNLGVGCPTGTAECDNDFAARCETSTDHDPANCGGCGVVCTAANATPACVGGACTIGSCDPAFVDSNGDYADGCESPCPTGTAECDGDATTACETDVTANPANCGGCGVVCQADNATATCADSACAIVTCTDGFTDADGDFTNGCELEGSTACEAGSDECDGDPETVCETDITSDAAHCGACGTACTADHATTTCVDSACGIAACETNYSDDNGDYSDGCEAFCDPTAEDLPDAAFLDTNCDGIDGDAGRAVFVSTAGSDDAAGTREAPLLTIAAAIEVARREPAIDHVYVAGGVYEGTVLLENGVSIFGGYFPDAGWSRGGGAVTELSVPETEDAVLIGISGVDIVAPTTVADVTVSVARSLAAGGSSYGVNCLACTGLVLDRVQIHVSGGTDGADGTTGTAGNPGGSGSGGSGGCCNCSSRGDGGSGGFSSCGRTGGSGGSGGSSSGGSGSQGSSGAGGASGGFGGSSGDPGRDGSDGSNGSNGVVGAAGGGGAAEGNVVDGLWVASEAGPGVAGTHGAGGGGGGRGRQDCLTCINGAGSGGGGGGGGGCGGGGGAPVRPEARRSASCSPGRPAPPSARAR